MNKRILSVFVFSAALLSIQAQDRKGGISDAMLNQIKRLMLVTTFGGRKTATGNLLPYWEPYPRLSHVLDSGDGGKA